MVHDRNTKMSKLETKLEENINTCVQEVPDKVTKTWAELVKQSDSNKPSAASDEQVSNIVKRTVVEHKHEEKARENREANIIIHRVQESDEEDP